MKAENVYYAFQKAQLMCPQQRAWSDWQIVNGYKIAELKQDMYKCLSFWLGNTLGGRIIWEKGYYKHLPSYLQELPARLDQAVDKEIKKIAEELKKK